MSSGQQHKPTGQVSHDEAADLSLICDLESRAAQSNSHRDRATLMKMLPGWKHKLQSSRRNELDSPELP
jgi:hypothetical protein